MDVKEFIYSLPTFYKMYWLKTFNSYGLHMRKVNDGIYIEYKTKKYRRGVLVFTLSQYNKVINNMKLEIKKYILYKFSKWL